MKKVIEGYLYISMSILKFLASIVFMHDENFVAGIAMMISGLFWVGLAMYTLLKPSAR